MDDTGCNMFIQNGSSVIKDSTVKTWLDSVYLPQITSSFSASGADTTDLVVTLPSMEQLAKVDGKSFEQNQITFTSSWLTTTSYWTKTASNINSSFVWNVVGDYNNSYIKYANDKASAGVRPVITTLKSNIKNG